LPAFDFAQLSGAQGWVAAHDISKLEATTNGLVVTISGPDPFLTGPSRNYPSNQPLWLHLRLKADQSGTCQVFYFQTGPTEANSVRFYVPGGDWAELRVPLPALWSQTRLRMDPPGTGGTCVLGRMNFELRPVIQEPAWPKPVPPVIAVGSPSVASGELSLVHDNTSLGTFEVRVNGQSAAVGNTRTLLGYTRGPTTRWLTLTNPVAVEQLGAGIQVRAAFSDPDGGQWQLEQTFQPAAKSGGIDVESRATVSQDRPIVFLPLLTLLPGVGSFGTNKTQAVLAGVEYLENEPSSSEADVIGPASRRRVPDSLKLTFPLTALSMAGRYVGLIWEPQPQFAVLHDSPDRLFQSGGHLMGVIFPGAAPATREDGSVLPYGGQTQRAGETLVLRATIIGGSGNTIVPAVQQFVARRPLPPVPNPGHPASDYFSLAAHGWLDSQIRDGAKFRHAVGANFGSMPAADAALYMDWLSAKVSDATLSARLRSAARDARAIVLPARYNSAAVGHVRFPVEALVYGSVADNATTALNEGRAQLTLFRPDGAILYQPPATGTDLSRTHWSREANGLSATHVAIVLERGLFSGDGVTIHEGLRLLRALDKFRETVPRGAQTWEVPLHTPDILASAYLVRAYTLGYELTGEAGLLEPARYWAWTGVPFVYLRPPSDKPVGTYSTIPVLGATEFVAPLWIGLPVQWCGLVYGNAIRRFARHDPNGPWAQLADGIAAAGTQQTHPLRDVDYQGLLPDSFDLRFQARNPVPINPATLLPEAIEMFGEPPVYDFRSLRHHGLMVHAPGLITEIQESSGGVSFRVNGWPKSPWYVLINGFSARPGVKLNGIETPLNLPHQYQATEGRLILRLEGPGTVEIQTPAKDAMRIQKSATNAALRISWPLAATNDVFERSEAFAFASAWREVTGQVIIEGSERVLCTTANQVAEFFRLRGDP